MSWEVLAAAAAARSLDELLLSHGAEGRSSGNLKYPLKQQKAHSLVLTRIIQPGTRSRKTERETEVSFSPPPLQEPLDYMFHISPHQRLDVIFPALFSNRLSTQFVEKHERLQRSPGAGAGSRAGASRAPCRGRGTRGQKRKPQDRSVARVVGCCSPETTNVEGVVAEGLAAPPKPLRCVAKETVPRGDAALRVTPPGNRVEEGSGDTQVT